MQPEDDLIWVERVEDERLPVIGIYKEADGTISFSSSVSPIQTARIFAGLTSHILENNLG